MSQDQTRLWPVAWFVKKAAYRSLFESRDGVFSHLKTGYEIAAIPKASNFMIEVYHAREENH